MEYEVVNKNLLNELLDKATKFQRLDYMNLEVFLEHHLSIKSQSDCIGILSRDWQQTLACYYKIPPIIEITNVNVKFRDSYEQLVEQELKLVDHMKVKYMNILMEILHHAIS